MKKRVSCERVLYKMLTPWYQNRRFNYVGGCVNGSPLYPMDMHQMMAEAASRENPRDARNKAEKQRRDKLNGSITELAGLVPLVAESSRKIDKTGILRLTAHDLRKEHVFGSSMGMCHMKPHARHIDTFLRLMDGFFITTTCRGIFLVASANIEHYLGHIQTDLLGQNIFNITHPSDVERFKAQLMPSDVSMSPNGQLLTSPDYVADFPNKKRDFFVRLARAVQRSEVPQYVLCRVDGFLRLADHARPGSGIGTQVMRRHRSRGEETINSSGNDVVFVGMVHVMKPTCFSERLIEASKQEYRTRHLIDGRIVHCDQRISLVAGYLTNEISGVSAFTFMHREDVPWVIIALRQMYNRNNKFGESCYRLISRTGQFLYMKTRGYLEITHGSNAIESFVCVNTLISDEEGKSCVDEMKMKYSVVINTASKEYHLLNSSGKSAVNDPQKLEQVIMQLITNLPSPSAMMRENSSPSPSNLLTIVPPKRSSVKITIQKSVSVINQTIRLNPYNEGLIVKSESLIPNKTLRPSVVQCHSSENTNKIENNCFNKPTTSSNVEQENKTAAKLTEKCKEQVANSKACSTIDNDAKNSKSAEPESFLLNKAEPLKENLESFNLRHIQLNDGDVFQNSNPSPNYLPHSKRKEKKGDIYDLDKDTEKSFLSTKDIISRMHMLQNTNYCDMQPTSYSGGSVLMKRPRNTLEDLDAEKPVKRRMISSEGELTTGHSVIQNPTQMVDDNFSCHAEADQPFDSYIQHLTSSSIELDALASLPLTSVNENEMDEKVNAVRQCLEQDLHEMFMSKHPNDKKLIESISLDHCIRGHTKEDIEESDSSVVKPDT